VGAGGLEPPPLACKDCHHHSPTPLDPTSTQVSASRGEHERAGNRTAELIALPSALPPWSGRECLDRRLPLGRPTARAWAGPDLGERGQGPVRVAVHPAQAGAQEGIHLLAAGGEVGLGVGVLGGLGPEGPGRVRVLARHSQDRLIMACHLSTTTLAYKVASHYGSKRNPETYPSGVGDASDIGIQSGARQRQAARPGPVGGLGGVLDHVVAVALAIAGVPHAAAIRGEHGHASVARVELPRR
jgi:hypothetical protein